MNEKEFQKLVQDPEFLEWLEERDLTDLDIEELAKEFYEDI